MELLIRIVDKIDPEDPVKHHRLTKAGDVIVYKPDGHDWGIEEVNNPHWRIIRVPDMPENVARSLIAEQVPSMPGQLLKRRAVTLDISKLSRIHETFNKARGYRLHKKTTRKQRIDSQRYIDAEIPLEHFLPARTVKGRLQLPTHIGPDHTVLGPGDGG